MGRGVGEGEASIRKLLVLNHLHTVLSQTNAAGNMRNGILIISLPNPTQPANPIPQSGPMESGATSSHHPRPARSPTQTPTASIPLPRLDLMARVPSNLPSCPATEGLHSYCVTPWLRAVHPRLKFLLPACRDS